METVEAYLDRKHEELRLLNDCLRTPLPLARSLSLAEVIQQKFQLTAALKAEHALHDWAVTETAWAHAGQPRSGPFEFRYDYQRADLDVRGPSFYNLENHSTSDTIYTISGMAAIAAVLFASAKLIDQGDILVLPGSYGETRELIDSYAHNLRLVANGCGREEAIARAGSPRMMLLDSSSPASIFEATLRCMRPGIDLLIFDTTCFSASSGRIRRVLNWAQKWSVPVAMVRSHTKLDSLGAEHGRLGSAVFVRWEKNASWAPQSKFRNLPTEMRNALRLFGGAALPAHFPPYVGKPAYRELTRKRMAAVLRNCRHSSQYFASALPGLTAELRFAHGLYVTLKSAKPLDEATARQEAAALSQELARAGLPIRHAGSFGFDFAATEWFRDAATGQYSVRIAVPDLPTPLWDDLTRAIAKCWSMHQRTIHFVGRIVAADNEVGIGSLRRELGEPAAASEKCREANPKPSFAVKETSTATDRAHSATGWPWT
jgi:hypothetical protein